MAPSNEERRPAEVTDAMIDETLSRIVALAPDAEEAAFHAFAARQPHIVAFVAAVSEEYGDAVEELAVDLLYEIDAVFADLAGAPLPTIADDVVQRTSLAVVSALEAALASGAPAPAPPQPRLMAFVEDSLGESFEDEDGESNELGEEERAELVITFRTVVTLLDDALRARA